MLCQVSLAQCGAGIAVAVQANQLGKLSLIGENEIPQAVSVRYRSSRLRVPDTCFQIWLSGSALADIMITASLAWIVRALIDLIYNRSQSFSSSGSVHDRLGYTASSSIAL